MQSGTLEKYNYCPLFQTHITNDYMVRNYYYYYYDDGDDCDCDLSGRDAQPGICNDRL